MPGPDALYSEEYGVRSFYPKDEEEHKALVAWANQAFTAANSARQDHYDRWKRWYKLYQSYVQRPKGSWESKVFWPLVFYTVETVAPRLVSSLPKFTVYPVGEQDVEPAQQMEQLMHWATQNSDLYVELVKSVKSALKYGTGILKTYWKQEKAIGRVPQPVMQAVMEQRPVMDGDQQVLSMDGRPVVEEVQVGEEPAVDEEGNQLTEFTPQEYVIYEGPAAEAIDIFNFWVAPEAEEIPGARYVIDRRYRDWAYIERMAKEGDYKIPEWLTKNDIASTPDEPMTDKLGEIEIGVYGNADPTRKPVEILEFWTDDNRVITVANRKAILRVIENPYDHGQKPFVRVVDILNEHEFWGTGEIQPLEGLQDYMNAQINQRIDNVRLVLNKMFGVNVKEIADMSDLESRPGGVVRITSDIPVRDVLMPIDFGDITGSAYTEVAEAERFSEKVSSVGAYQIGVETPSTNRTATGASLMNEAGNSRFSLKTRLMELIGLRPLARQFGSLLQQYVSEEKVIRITEQQGGFQFIPFSPESIQGALDYDIEVSSSTQTETVRKDQTLTLFQTVVPLYPQAAPALLEDVLKAFGVKDFSRYVNAVPPGIDPTTGMPMDPNMMGNGQPPTEDVAAIQAAMQGGQNGQPPPAY